MEIKFFYYGHVICLTDRTDHISNAGQWNEADHPRKKDGRFVIRYKQKKLLLNQAFWVEQYNFFSLLIMRNKKPRKVIY